MHRVTVNVVLMHRRAARSRPVFAEEPPDRRDACGASPRRLTRTPSAASGCGPSVACSDRLAEKKRIVFILHELEGLSPSEIARHRRCPRAHRSHAPFLCAPLQLETMLRRQSRRSRVCSSASPRPARPRGRMKKPLDDLVREAKRKATSARSSRSASTGSAVDKGLFARIELEQAAQERARFTATRRWPGMVAGADSRLRAVFAVAVHDGRDRTRRVMATFATTAIGAEQARRTHRRDRSPTPWHGDDRRQASDGKRDDPPGRRHRGARRRCGRGGEASGRAELTLRIEGGSKGRMVTHTEGSLVLALAHAAARGSRRRSMPVPNAERRSRSTWTARIAGGGARDPPSRGAQRRSR